MVAVALAAPVKDDIVVVAYEDSKVPGILLSDGSKVVFEDFKNHRVWCCEIVGEELRVCLVPR
jgi:hypothetical protein